MEVKQFGIDVIVIEPGSIKSEWSDIATQHLQDKSIGKAYGKMAENILRFAEKNKLKNKEPEVIAKLILKAVTAKNPKTR